MNLPNALTVLRALLIPVFVRLFYLPNYVAALAVFLLASATDCLDGYLARKWNQVTRFGKLMDPLADKLMLLCALYCLTDYGSVPLWVLIALLVKELAMVLGAAFLFSHKVVVQAAWPGKCATVAFIAAMFALFPWHEYGWLFEAGRVALYAALALSLLALAYYAAGYVKSVKAR